MMVFKIILVKMKMQLPFENEEVCHSDIFRCTSMAVINEKCCLLAVYLIFNFDFLKGAIGLI